MIRYADAVMKAFAKGKLPRSIFEQFHHVFQALDLTNDLSMFDIKLLKRSEDESRSYFRVRKGKYRAIFYVENSDYYVISIAKRDEVYKKWQ